MAGNAFDLSGGLAPPDEIHVGGPPRDGIPALTDPAFVPAAQADFLAPDDRILGLTPGGEARAYPIAILNRHEIVNDGIGGRAVAVTYCPLCGTGVAFDALHTGRRVEFGVSGLLYNSDVLLYDRQTESLWSQIAKQAVTGPMKGQRKRARLRRQRLSTARHHRVLVRLVCLSSADRDLYRGSPALTLRHGLPDSPTNPTEPNPTR
ncbi:DUF3179 domain-containing (seleno)protein [Thiocapsa sp.]|uniref:DUF3179 domain-containing (seleno)protein n=1 Tax=Thiocapsa sp. TaxID=2024551 RepID=UPI0035938B65